MNLLSKFSICSMVEILFSIICSKVNVISLITIGGDPTKFPIALKASIGLEGLCGFDKTDAGLIQDGVIRLQRIYNF